MTPPMHFGPYRKTNSADMRLVSCRWVTFYFQWILHNNYYVCKMLFHKGNLPV